MGLGFSDLTSVDSWGTSRLPRSEAEVPNTAQHSNRAAQELSENCLVFDLQAGRATQSIAE
jgi:hypothetical protein